MDDNTSLRSKTCEIHNALTVIEHMRINHWASAFLGFNMSIKALEGVRYRVTAFQITSNFLTFPWLFQLGWQRCFRCSLRFNDNAIYSICCFIREQEDYHMCFNKLLCWIVCIENLKNSIFLVNAFVMVSTDFPPFSTFPSPLFISLTFPGFPREWSLSR